MKSMCLFTLSIFTLLPLFSIADPYVRDLTLSSQAEVNAAAGITLVSGSLEVSDNLEVSGSDISDLSA